MSYSEVLAADQRLMILQALAEDGDYAHNESVLQTVLSAVGHGISIDALRAHLQALEEIGLVTLEKLPVVGLVAHLTQRGADVARGRAKAPGVARPRPGSTVAGV